MEYSLLIDAARALLAIQDFEKAARTIFDACKKATGATAGYVAILSDDGSENKVLFLDPGGMPCTVDPALPMPIRGLRETAYRTMEVVYDNDFCNSQWMKYMPEGHASLRNVMFAPLVIDEKALGLLGLANKQGGFDDNDARIARVYADLAAISMKNSMMMTSLEDSERRFKSIAQTATDAIITVDSSGVVQFWNEGATRMFGLTSEEMIGKKLDGIMPERYLERHDSSMTRAKKGVHHLIGKTVEVEGIRNDGTEFPIELSLATWSTKEGTFYTSIIRDITERKMADEAITQAKRKLNLMSQITRHDMINNVTILMGFQSMAEKVAVDPRQKILLRSLNKTINSLKDQIEFTRLYQDIGVRAPDWISLSDVIKAELEEFATDGISIMVDVGDIEIYADPMFRNVIHNLIDNSIRHGKKVTKITIGYSEDHPCTLVFFEDDGVGVPNAEKKLIFERGYGKHTGLGLYLIREILGITGMEIRENGIPGKGARFEISVPMVRFRHCRR